MYTCDHLEEDKFIKIDILLIIIIMLIYSALRKSLDNLKR